jgi:predicted AlkP superfamily pyrophosphatase or phosphodiesterase
VEKGLSGLVDKLKANELWGKVNLMIVSDHGMVDTSIEKVIYLDEFVDMKLVQHLDNGPFQMMYPHRINGINFIPLCFKEN